LRERTPAERARALVAIAAPEHRPALARAAAELEL
jgi:acyl-CoA hydrolase